MVTILLSSMVVLVLFVCATLFIRVHFLKDTVKSQRELLDAEEKLIDAYKTEIKARVDYEEALKDRITSLEAVIKSHENLDSLYSKLFNYNKSSIEKENEDV